MLIVLTSDTTVPNEAEILNTLFAEGLEILHLRKPDLDQDGYAELLKQVRPEYRNRIMIHQYHDLVTEFGLRGAHLQEQPRYDLGEELEEYISRFRESGYSVSSSYHSKEEVTENGHLFEYVLLSPVFGSISKIGYEGKGFDVLDITEANVIGMGGINEETIPKTYALGFAGVAVLGGVWSRKNPVAAFRELQSADQSVVKKSL